MSIHRRESTKSARRRSRFPIHRSGFVLAIGMLLLFVLGLSHEADAVRSPSSWSGKSSTNRHPNSTTAVSSSDLPRGGGRNAAAIATPSMYWAVLHNWLYYLSLGFNAVNIPYMIREIVDGNPNAKPSPQSIALSGNVEAVDKILTFGGVAFLAALSDKHGRKPLIAWSSFGFAITNLVQAFAGRAPTTGASKTLLYLADLVDGCSSCMSPVCQAYVADCSGSGAGSSLASNLGIFQGISIGGAFVFAFPIGGLLGAKFGPRLPILMAAGFQVLNGLLAIFVTPESNNPQNRIHKKILFSDVNPITGLQKLFGIGSKSFGSSIGSSNSRSLLRTASLTYLCLSMARGALDAQFVNYSNIRFGWTQAQAGPVLVMTGLMLAIVPRILIPLLGMQRAINGGILVVGLGLSSAGLVAKSAQFVGSIGIVSIGFVAIPALMALLANLAPPGQSGALLGAVGSMSELSGAISSSMYATLLATFATTTTASTSTGMLSTIQSALPDIPGMHFLVGASFCLLGWAVSSRGLHRDKGHPALSMSAAK